VSSVFGLYSRYYDLLYQEKDYEGETAYIRSLIDRFAPATRDVLEFGCGTGKHARLLAKTGLRVTGVDQSADMIAVARHQIQATDRNGSVDTFHGDARSIRLDRKFDTVLALFHVVSYQVTDEDVLAMLDTAAKHLRDGGLFIFDVWYGPAVLHLKPQRRVKEIEDQRYHIVRIAEPTCDFDRNVVEVKYDISVTDKSTGRRENFSENHPMRYFFAPEIALFARSSEMEVVHSEQWLDGAKPSSDTWGVTFVLQKRS